MILKGSQRSGARQLAAHLLKEENDHVELVELRGFVAENLPGAFDEAHAIAKGTRCKQFLFSLSLNPPQDQVLNPEAFPKAADEIEARLSLSGQPRAIVIHEKEGRRHAHAVWSRIDPETMTARPLPFFKTRLRDLSRELYLKHGWALPDGLRDPLLKNPLNFSREEWQQAQRTERDPREIKQVFQEAWSQSDGRKALAAALLERGFILAKGDRRGHVAIDHMGEVYALARWVGVRTKEVKDRLGLPDDLPSVEEAKDQFRKVLSPKLDQFRQDQKQAHAEDRQAFKAQKAVMVREHRAARQTQKDLHQERWQAETTERAARLRKGIPGLWDRVTGKAAQTRERNEREAWLCLQRDQTERDALAHAQIEERRSLQGYLVALRDRHRFERRELDRDMGHALAMEGRREAALDRIRQKFKGTSRNGLDLER